MDISALNSRITIQKSNSVCDEVGNYTLRWEDYFSCYATISNASGGEDEKGDVAENESLSFTVRYCKKAVGVNSTEYRISFNNKTYNIKYVDLMGFKKKSIKFKAELVV
ncbi:MAG TPA: head-tail adaptor protein [Lachnospiraceae bacterium]|nr:head-tail adaptor protein [Lachnospiraceae bacterium]